MKRTWRSTLLRAAYADSALDLISITVGRALIDTDRRCPKLFMMDYHARSLALVDEIERTYPVTQWQVGDVPVWPLARLILVELGIEMTRGDFVCDRVTLCVLRPPGSRFANHTRGSEMRAA